MMIMKKRLLIILLLFSFIFLTGCSNTNDLGINFSIDGNVSDEFNYDTDNPTVALKIKNYGAIVIELYPDIAPNTVNNFISLVKSGFYDGNTFHRLVPGFVLQGGDPTGTGTGGPGYTIKGEFTNNGFTNTLKHEKYIVSMARSSDYNSAGSQFFIMLDESTSLNNDYAAFGKVIDGFDVIDDIVKYETVENTSTGKLKKNLTIEKALVNTKNKDYDEPVTIK
jgi:peptidyl-prolyl cis-trans isomerase B (cyclophilin B)